MPFPLILGFAATLGTGTTGTSIFTVLLSSFSASLSMRGIATLISNNNLPPLARNRAIYDAALETERETMRTTREAAEEAVQTSVQTIETTVEVTHETQTQINTETRRLEAQNTDMQTEINRLNAAINTLNEANQTAEMMLTTLNAELNTLREQSSTINHHLTEATEALHLTEERLAETIHQFDTLRHSLSTNEANHQTEITRLQNELERAAPNETQDNQMLQQELNTVTERYQEATRMLRIYAETLRGTQRQMNTQNPEGETSNDEQRNSATTNSL